MTKPKAKKPGKKSTRKTAAKSATPMVVPSHGNGALLAGGKPGNRGGTGRPAGVIREGLREPIPQEIAKLEANVARIETLVAEYEALDRSCDEVADDTRTLLGRRESKLRAFIGLQERLMVARKELLDYRAKYGLGTTITETDADGNNPPPKSISVALVRPNFPDAVRAESRILPAAEGE